MENQNLAVIKNLPLNDKIRLLRGNGAWQIWNADGKLPAVMMCDGPHGLRKQIQDAPGQNNESIPATCFPTESAIACSWDPEAVARMASAIAEEALAEDVSIMLGCGVNMKRSPLCGRNFEYFSEDPYLTGVLATSYIRAMQDKGVGTSLKHFAGNNQETHRQTANSQIDERALREIYLAAFEKVVKEAKPWTIMASYNRLNGLYACENQRLLTDILRNEWGYQGCVISDWGACVDSSACLHAGMDLEMPDSLGFHTKQIEAALESGKLFVEDIDRAAENIAELISKTQNRGTASANLKKHHELAVKLEQESAVLLKNNHFFPIPKNKTIIIIGELAEHMRFQGGGSSHINAYMTSNIIREFQKKNCKVLYSRGYDCNSDIPDEKLEKQTLELLREKQNENIIVLFFGGLNEQYEGEGYDRSNFKLPGNQTALLDKIHAIQEDIGIITFGGSPFEMPFAEWAKAILQMYLGGQGVGEACVSLLLGEVSPCGKLAESWPLQIEDTPCYDSFGQNSNDVEYRESIFIGYRYYDTYHLEVRYPFGHGLSYTQFEYSELVLSASVYEKGNNLTISCRVKNIGKYAASEIVQFYVENPNCNYLRAKRELRGFQKVYLEPGQEKDVSVILTDRSFSIYDTCQKGFLIPSGTYTICVAASSKDIRLKQEITVKGINYDRDERKLLAEYFQGLDTKLASTKHLFVSKEQFQLLYGDQLSQLDTRRRGEFDLHDSLDCLSKHSLFAKLFLKIAERIAYSMYPGKDHDDPEVKMTLQGIHEGCLDCVFCQGQTVPYKIAEAIVLSANGHPLRSLRKLIEKSNR